MGCSPWGYTAEHTGMRRVEADGLVAVKKPTKNIRLYFLLGFPNSSVGKESTCNAGDPSLIPGSGRSTGQGKGYPLQSSGLENSMDHNRVRQRGVTESDTTGLLSLSLLPMTVYDVPKNM